MQSPVQAFRDREKQEAQRTSLMLTVWENRLAQPQVTLEKMVARLRLLASDVESFADPAVAAQSLMDGIGALRTPAADLVTRVNRERDAQAGVNRALVLTAL